MSKTITLTSELGTVCNIDVDHLLAFSQGRADTKRLPLSWLELRLATYDCKWSLTPRGKDLLASIDSIPDDPMPEQPKVTPCKACEGKGERPLFVSMETCDACGGSGQERSKVHRIDPAHVRVYVDGEQVQFNPCKAIVGALGGHSDMLSRVVEAGAEAERLGYSATFTCDKVYSDGWWLAGLPEVGRYAEVKIATGEVLRGIVEWADSMRDNEVRLAGPESAPLAVREFGGDGWFTWSSGADGRGTRVGWRYVDAPKLDAPDDSR